jgi:integrase
MPVLTVAGIRRYRPRSERREIRDTQAPGLHLIIQPTGTMSWALRFRRPSGRPAKMTLGPYADAETAEAPVLGAPLSLLQAREFANTIARQRKLGHDVIEETKAQLSRERATATERAANTFAAAVREFFVEYKTAKWKQRPRRWRGDARLLGLQWPSGSDPAITEPEVVPGSLADIWSNRPVAAIDAHDVHVVVEEASQQSDGRGRKLHAALSVLFSWLTRRRRVAVNPAAGVYHPGPPPSRDRILSDGEIKSFWLASDRAPTPFGAALKVLLLTGCRLNEVAAMRHEEVNDHGVWIIPAARTKNHRVHLLPLPPLAVDIITSLPRIEGGLVFTTTGRAPISGWSKVKRSVDAAMGSVPDWRIHDLRRTTASGMQRLGVRTEVIERTLNHISGSYRGVAGTYQRDPLSEEVREALLRWAAHLERLVAGKPAKVVALRGPAP